jgi:hypothetical protein
LGGIAYLPSTADVEVILDALGESRNQWSNAGDERSIGPPVPASIVPVDTVVFVKLMDIELPLFDQVVIGDDGAGEWAHETGVAGKEG